jgi:hypothetical protein
MKGKAATNIESLTIVAGEEIKSLGVMQSPNEFYGVLLTLGALRVQQLEGHMLSPPVSISAGGSYLLFDASIAGEPMDIDRIVRGLEIRGGFRQHSTRVTKNL